MALAGGFHAVARLSMQLIPRCRNSRSVPWSKLPIC